MYCSRDHVDCVCLCRLVFFGYSSIYRVNVDGTDKREIVSDLGINVYALSIDHINHVCWGQRGKSQIIALSGAHIK